MKIEKDKTTWTKAAGAVEISDYQVECWLQKIIREEGMKDFSELNIQTVSSGNTLAVVIPRFNPETGERFYEVRVCRDYERWTVEL